MRSIFFLAFIGLFFIGSAAAHESGFYTGAGVILSQSNTNAKERSFTGNGTDVNNSNIDIRKSFVNLNLFAGYQKYWGNSFFATELFVTPLQDTTKKTNILAYQDNDSGNLLFQNIQLKTERQFSAGGRFKYGRHFDSKTAAFLSLGLLGSQFKVRHSDNSPQAANYKSFQFAYAPGAGIKYYIKQHVPITLQYDYEIYNRFSTKNMSSVAQSGIQYKLENRYHNFMISISCEL